MIARSILLRGEVGKPTWGSVRGKRRAVRCGPGARLPSPLPVAQAKNRLLLHKPMFEMKAMVCAALVPAPFLILRAAVYRSSEYSPNRAM